MVQIRMSTKLLDFFHGWRGIVAVLIAVLIFLWLLKAPVMSTYITSKLGVPITVRTISLWPHSTKIGHFRIANPEGYRPSSALVIDKTVISYTWPALTGYPHVIDLITLKGVTLNIYLNNSSGKDNNWTDIGAQMPSTRDSREVLVKKLVLYDMTVNVAGPGAKTLGVAGTKHFDQMEFENIDSKTGFPTKELIANIFQTTGFQQFIQLFLDPVKTFQRVLNPFNLFGQKENPREESRGSLLD